MNLNIDNSLKIKNVGDAKNLIISQTITIFFLK